MSTPAEIPSLSPLPNVMDLTDPSQERVLQLLRSHPLPRGDNKQFAYGTAGFRQAADTTLEAVVVRTGITAVLRSLQHHGQAVGVMITASHNDETYNGVKVADPHGGMLAPDGERMAIYLANERNEATVWDYIQQQRQRQQAQNTTITAVVHVGRDTRVHSPRFRDLLVQMIIALGGRVVDHGICTTPMLHHAVLHANFVLYLPGVIPPRPHVGGYLELTAYSYLALLSCTTGEGGSYSTRPSNKTLVVDCACGVGYPALRALLTRLEALRTTVTTSTTTSTSVLPTNGPGMGPLNEGCGSEHVQKEQRAPHWYQDTPVSTQYCASLDGDADRIVFFIQNSNRKNGSLQLLDGDKIACLFCEFIQEQLAVLGSYRAPIRLGVVQTAYANGASTAILQKLVGPENVLIAKTGVKHVHHAAHTFDIGVYFEANGHGTVLFGPKFYKAIALLASQVDGAAAVALKRLELLPALLNQAVGDAVSVLLFVDAILTLQGRSLVDWYNMYQDSPSRQSKVMIPDRTIIQTNDNETKCLQPPGLQQDLDKAMQALGGRTFVRPSGTEDVVRIYAEGPTQKDADELAKRAQRTVQRFTLPSKM